MRAPLNCRVSPRHEALARYVLALAFAGACLPALAEDLELYMDSETKQIYAEPAPNRQRLGKFRPIVTVRGVGYVLRVEVAYA
jgi:hypothetical protein